MGLLESWNNLHIGYKILAVLVVIAIIVFIVLISLESSGEINVGLVKDTYVIDSTLRNPMKSYEQSVLAGPDNMTTYQMCECKRDGNKCVWCKKRSNTKSDFSVKSLSDMTNNLFSSSNPNGLNEFSHPNSMRLTDATNQAETFADHENVPYTRGKVFKDIVSTTGMQLKNVEFKS